MRLVKFALESDEVDKLSSSWVPPLLDGAGSGQDAWRAHTEMAGAGKVVMEDVFLKIGAMLVVACASLLGALPPLWQQTRSQQPAGTGLSDVAYLTRAFTVSPIPCARAMPLPSFRLQPSVLNATAACSGRGCSMLSRVYDAGLTPARALVWRCVLQAGIMLSLAFVHVIADGFTKMEVRLQRVRMPQVSGDA